MQIQRFSFGSPIETEAIPVKPAAAAWSGEAAGLSLTEEDGALVFRTALEDDDIVYGLGENVRGIDKRRWIYTSHNSDEPHHEETKRSLYGSHNFLMVCGTGGDARAFFFDTPGEITFDVGYTRRTEMKITVPDGSVELYVIEASSPDGAVTALRRLTGRSYIPPRWAFGYGQSRWSYMNADEVREVVRRHREAGIPLDSVYLDIDYMERYKDFTVDGEAFPDFAAFVAELKAQGVHPVPIIDAGVKIEEGYPVWEEGHEKGYFCKDENGEDFVVGVWPGRCALPDMLNDEARAWFGNGYRSLLDMGVDGFWNDMNEPALFYSEKRIRKTFDDIAAFRGRSLDVNTFFDLMRTMGSVANNPEDYASFYHQYRGERVRHDKVHNLYGYFMTRSASEAFRRLVPDRRILMYSRSSYIGMHRYAGIWQGDNTSWWSHMALNFRMMPSLNMCGFLYTGADVGGFNGDTTEDLVLRWLCVAVFTPLMRNHSARWTRLQEVYRFDSWKAMRGVIRLRYRLIPYLYSAFMKAALGDTMMFRPLGFVWPSDRIARRVEDQLLVGDSIMIAPVLTQNADGRTVYLPERMKLLRFRGEEMVEEKVLDQGHVWIDMPLGDVCVFLREGHSLPLAEPAETVDAIDDSRLTVYSFGDAQPCELYRDDGITPLD